MAGLKDHGGWLSSPSTLYSWSNEPEDKEIMEARRQEILGISNPSFKMTMEMNENLDIFIRIYESRVDRWDTLVHMEDIYHGG